MIKIDGQGLEPLLEAFMLGVLDGIRVRMHVTAQEIRLPDPTTQDPGAESPECELDGDNT